MTSILNLFSNFNDLTKTKSVTDNVTDYKVNITSRNKASIALKQGTQFKKYQDKIINNLEQKIQKDDLMEGFDNLNLDKNGLTEQTNNLISKNDFSSQKQIIDNLKLQHANTLKEYNKLSSQISENTSRYIDRVNTNNPYLGKVIKFQNGNLCYVTNQGVAKWFPTKKIYLNNSGKNGFPPEGQFTTLPLKWSNNYQSPGAIIPTTPSLITGTPIEDGESVGNEGSNVYVNSIVNKPQSSYIGCYNNIDTVNVDAKTPAMSNVGKMNFDKCQNYALNSDNKYFGLQSVDNNEVGNCMVSNDLSESKMYGNGINYTNTILWSSNTKGSNIGTTSNFENGSLNVINSSGASIFSTPNNTKQPSNYIGCYADKSARAMTIYNKGAKKYNNTTCQAVAQSQGALYYGLQDSKTGQNASCALSDSLSQAQQYGVAKNCTKIRDGSWSGGGWSNALYSTETPTNNYFLILQDDGNMCIYLGNSPSDNQGLIWSTKSNGKQQSPNENFTAVKGKYGKNWIPNGSTLASGDFIGSTNGSVYLIMQNDGDLVLYTSSGTSKCSISGGKTVGAQDTNALYQIINMGNKDSIGKLAYIDQNSELHSYPPNNFKYSDVYTSYIGFDSSGNDISGATFGNTTVEQCQTSCTSNKNCAGFTFTNNVCYPKTSIMFPNGESQINKNVNLYARNKSPKTLPIGVNGTVVNIDSNLYYNYKKGDEIGDSYGLKNATNTQKQQLSQLQNRLDLLTSEINKYTNKFENGSKLLNNQASKNIGGLGDYLKDFKKTNNNIKNFNTNIENILNDSDITVLQKNYDYLFWSILATGTVLVTMNI
jgi:hypothetical protein